MAKYSPKVNLYAILYPVKFFFTTLVTVFLFSLFTLPTYAKGCCDGVTYSMTLPPFNISVPTALDPISGRCFAYNPAAMALSKEWDKNTYEAQCMAHPGVPACMNVHTLAIQSNTSSACDADNGEVCDVLSKQCVLKRSGAVTSVKPTICSGGLSPFDYGTINSNCNALYRYCCKANNIAVVSGVYDLISKSHCDTKGITVDWGKSCKEILEGLVAYGDRNSCEPGLVFDKDLGQNPEIFRCMAKTEKLWEFQNTCDNNQVGVQTAIGCVPTDDLKNTLSFVLKWVFYASGGIILLMFMATGFTLLTSQGNPEKLQAAKENIVALFSGLLLIVFSMVLLQAIGADILGLPGF